MSNTWCIYHVEKCRHALPKPKDKFIAIVCKDLDCMGFFVNTEIHPFINNSPYGIKTQVLIKVSDYSFLDHDSYINCFSIYPFEEKELTCWRSNINIVTKAEIKKALEYAKGVENRYKKLILSG